MKFTAALPSLRAAAAATARAVDAKATLPILKNLLVRAEGDGVIFTGTNLETTVVARAPATVSEPGAIALPAELFEKYLGLIDGEEISLDATDSAAKINGKTEIRGAPAADFPTVPAIPGKAKFAVPGAALGAALGRVSFAAAADLSRPAFGGVFFAPGGDAVRLAATDGYRLAEEKLPAPAASGENFLLPRRSAELVTTLFKTDAPVEVFAEKSQVKFAAENLEIQSRLIDGNFPDYAQIIPKKWAARATVPAGDFLTALRRAALFCGAAGHVRLRIDPAAGVEIAATGGEIGGDEIAVPAPGEGEPRDLALNPAYLVEALGKVSDGEIFLELEEEMRPAVLRAGENYLYLVMPVRA